MKLNTLVNKAGRIWFSIYSNLQQIYQSSKITELKNGLISANILHYSTSISPLRFYLLALGIGIILLAFSISVGMAFFHIQLEIELTNGEKILRSIDLGYISQSNYGLWYLVLCPLLLAVVACVYEAIEKAHENYPNMTTSIEELGKIWWIALIGISLLFFFVYKNLVVEWSDYKNLGLGWVQAKPLQDYRDEIEKNQKPIDLVAKGKAFDRFLLPKEDRFIQKNEIRSVFLVKVDSNLEVSGFWGMIIFIILTKLWVGLWESIVIYLAILTLVWGIKVAQNLDLQAIRDETTKFYHLTWIRRPAFYIFIVGCLVNLFCVLRYIGNAVKGSYGKWDQYWSLLILFPILFVLPFSLIMAKIYNSSDEETQIYYSKRVIIVAGIWLISFSYVVYLILGYINPWQQTILVACFKPFVDIFKKLFGFS